MALALLGELAPSLTIARETHPQCAHLAARYASVAVQPPSRGAQQSSLGAVRAFNKLARIFAAQVETLKRGMAQRLLPCSDA